MNGPGDASPTSQGLPDRLRRVGGRAWGIVRRTWAHPVARLAVLGLVVRLLLAPFTSWTGDMAFTYWTVLDMVAGRSPYASMNYAYPPGWAYTLAAPFLTLARFVPPEAFGRFVPSLVPVGVAANMVIPVVTSPLFNVVAKAPLIVGDLAAGLVIFEVVRGIRDVRTAKRAFALWFLNPLVILVGSVNGQFDVLASLFLLAGAYFLGRRSYAYAGASLAVSVAYKVFAAYLLPAYVVLIVFRPRREPAGSWREWPELRFAAGLGAAAAALLALFPWDTGLAALLRRVSVPSFGGFTIVTFLPPDLRGGPLVSTVLPLLALAAITLLAAYVVRARADEGPRTRDTMAFHAVAVVIVLATQPLVQPQYLLWLLPYVVVLGVSERGGWRRVALLSAVGMVYFAALAGPLAFFYPAAVWSGLGSTDAINASILTYWSRMGLFPDSTWYRMLANLALAGLLAFALEAWTSLDHLWRIRHGTEAAPPA